MRLQAILPALAVGLLTALVVGWGQKQVRRDHALAACIRAPASCQQELRVLGLHRVTSIEPPNHYTVQGPHLAVRIRGPIQSLRLDDAVSVGVRFHPTQGATEQWRVAHPYRFVKVWLGIIGVIFLLFACTRWFGWQHNQVVIRG